MEVLMIVVVGILLVPLLVFLAFVGYIVWIRRKYAHLPSPVTSSFFLGHMKEYNMYQSGGDSVRPLDKLYLKWYHELGSPSLFVIFLIWHPLIVSFDPGHLKELSSPRYSKPHFPYKWLQNSNKERFLGRSLLTILDYETWKPRRALYDPSFKSTHLNSLIPSFNECVDSLIDVLKEFPDGWEVPMRDELSIFVMDLITKVGFSMNLSREELGSLRQLVIRCLEGVEKQFRTPVPRYLIHPLETQQYRKYIQEFRAVGKQCIKERIAMLERGEPLPNDILSQILKVASKEETGDIETLVDDFIVFFFAGHETTGNLLSFTLILVLQHPDVLARLQEEIETVLQNRETVTAEDLNQLQYTEQVLLESLRVCPPAPGVFKETKPGGMMLDDYYIPRATQVIFNTRAYCQLQKNYDDPLSFNPDRFGPENPRPNSFVYFPFGVGHRTCIGKRFAIMEAKMVVTRLLQTFEFSLPQGYQLETAMNITMQPKGEVMCTIRRRCR